MLTLVGIVCIWLFVAIGCHVHRKQHYKKNPHLRARRGEGLISFSERQYWWLISLWPLTLVGAIVLLLMLALFGLIELFDEWRAGRQSSK